MDYDKKLEEWTKNDWLEFNRALERMGLPTLFIEDDVVYKDEFHKYLGVGFPIGGLPKSEDIVKMS